MVTSAIRAVWDSPRVPAPPSRPWWDVALVAALIPTALIEGIVRDDVPWAPYTTMFTMVCATALLWRARYPLGMLLQGRPSTSWCEWRARLDDSPGPRLHGT